MALNFPGLFGSDEIFGATPNDGDAALFYGARQIPGEIQSVTAIGELHLPTIVENDNSEGAIAWSSLNNAKKKDSANAEVINSVNDVAIDDWWGSLVIAGVVKATNRGTSTPFTSVYQIITMGSSSDLWGETPTAAQVNAFNFGMVFSTEDTGGIPTRSNFLKVLGFGFNVPASATIVGMIAKIKAKKEYTGGNNTSQIDSIEMSIYYT